MFTRYVSLPVCLTACCLAAWPPLPALAQQRATVAADAEPVSSQSGATPPTDRAEDQERQQAPVVRETVEVIGTPPAQKLSLDTESDTGSRLGLSVRETPASVTVVDRATIELRGAADTQAVLASVPGVVAAAPPGSAGAVWYRGFGAGQITQLFNGITVQYDAVAARPVDSWIYQEVSVIGGPSTFLFGAGAVGGSINYVTRTPSSQANSVDARVGVGSYNTSEVSIGVNRLLGQGRIRHALRADVSRTYSNGAVDGNERGATSTALSLLTMVGRRVTHTAALEFQDEQADRPYWGTPVLNPIGGAAGILDGTRFRNYNSLDSVYEQRVWWGRSILEYKPSSAVLLRNTVYHYDALRDFRNVEVYTFTPDNRGVIRSAPLLQRHDQALTGNRLEARFKTTPAGIESDWSAGLDVSANAQTRFPRSLTLNVSTVDPRDFVVERFFDVPGMVPGFVGDRTNDVGTVALFVENRTKVARGLSVVSGVRRDRIELQGTNLRAASAANPAYFRNVYRPVTGRAALTYAFRPRANVYAQFSTAADPPAGILTTASFAQVRDFDLTTGRQFEVGTKFDLPADRGAVTAAVYGIVRRNLAIADPLNPGTTLPVGQQSSRGLELAASVRAARSLLVQGNYAYTAAQYDEFTDNVGGVAVSRAGLRPTGVPVHVANGWITWKPRASWTFVGDARFVSERFANNANTTTAEAFTVFGAAVSRQLGRHLHLTGRIRNVTDRIYAAAITGTPMLFLGPPRTLELALRVSY